MNDPFNDCDCDNMFSSDSHYLTGYDATVALQDEKDAGDMLALYKQMKLQRQLEITSGLDPNFKQDLMYTNSRLMGDISAKIVDGNVNYPETYKGLTNDQNTNTILWAIQNRSIHLGLNPLYNQNDPNAAKL